VEIGSCKRDPALLEQLQEGDGGDHFRHRRQPEDAVGGHRNDLGADLVGLAEGLE
jgi:hypothetical protein